MNKIEELERRILKLKKDKKELLEQNSKLQDEVDSLWMMMDEMTKSDIENWSHLLDQLEKDTIVKALMVSKKKAEA